MRGFAARLRGLLASLVIVAVLIGLPWVLVRLGAPALPAHFDLAELWRILTNPDDGTLTITLIKVVAWAAWLVLTILIGVEIVARLRHVEAPNLRGLGLSQHAARSLVATAAMLFIAGSSIGNAAAAIAAAPVAAPVTATATSGTTSTQVTSDASKTTAETNEKTKQQTAQVATRSYTVQPGDTLWRIADHELGQGKRYHEIVSLNTERLSKGADFLRPGWTLQLPADANTVVVQPGDTLSAIARDHFDGDESKYQQIVDASAGIVQADGRHLTDPNLIYPGWVLHLQPTSAAQPAAQTAPQEPAAPAPSQTPAPADAPEQPSQNARATTGVARPDTDNEVAAPAEQQPVSAPASTATPIASQSTASTADAAQQDREVVAPAPWMLAGLTGGGVMLAGAMALVLKQRRAAQFRARRPGRMISAPPARLARVERTLVTVGERAAPTVEALDAVLRNLAASLASAQRPVPAVAAVELSRSHLMLHLVEPCDLPEPWRSDETRTHWELESKHVASAALNPNRDGAAPYPQLVTIGQSDDGTVWLFNAEEFGALALTGDPTYTADFARHLIAELTMSRWGRDVRIDTLAIGDELAGINPDRLYHHPAAEAEAVLESVEQHARVTQAAQAAAAVDADSLGGLRAEAAADRLWESRVVVAGRDTARLAVPLCQTALGAAGHAATAVFVIAQPQQLPAAAVEFQLTSSGRIRIAEFDLDLVAVGLTADEAAGCAALLGAAETLDDEPMPDMTDAEQHAEEWRESVNAAGQIREDLTVPSDQDETPDEDAERPETTTILEDAPEVYVAETAAVPEDFEALARRVPVEVRDAVLKADESLDADLEQWFAESCERPRVSVLGPVGLRFGNSGDPVATAKRKPFYVELAIYMALHPQGVTTEEVSDALQISKDRVRRDMSVLRGALGVNPQDGTQFLPESYRSAAATRERNVNAYQLQGVLVDADLFRRLRARGEAQGGVEGSRDLRRALQLVTGRPFDQMRVGGGVWLTEGQRFDMIFSAAIVDVAHMVAMLEHHRGDYVRARAAAEIGALAAPYEETPRLDLAAVAHAEGRLNEMDRILRSEVCNRSDDGEAPAELSERTAAILQSHRWLDDEREAS